MHPLYKPRSPFLTVSLQPLTPLFYFFVLLLTCSKTYSPDLGNSSTLGCSVLGRLEVPTLCISTMRTQMRKIERIVI